MLNQQQSETQTTVPSTRTNHLRAVRRGEAEALADVGEPLSSRRCDDHLLMQITNDYWAIVGPDTDLPAGMRVLIAGAFNHDQFAVTWSTFGETLVTKFLRIL